MKQCLDCGRLEGSKATFLRVSHNLKCDECLRIYEAKTSREYYNAHKAEVSARRSERRAAENAAKPAPVCRPVTRPATCHPGKQYHAKGLCASCYNSDLVFRKLGQVGKMAPCHPDRPHKAGGLCQACYMVERRKKRKQQQVAYVRDNTEALKLCSRVQQLKRYGLSILDYLIMLQDQSCRCAICLHHMDSPNVDHDHATGAVRGLLCSPCNRAIGFLRDDPDLARSAVNYLENTLIRPLNNGTSEF
jgi:hypothetical protein